MSAAHNFQGSCEMQNPDSAQAKVGELPPTYTAPNATIIPSKRSDDDVQFISSKPVKRRKISEQKPGPTCQPQFSVSTTPAPLAIPAPAPAPVPVPAVPFSVPTTTQAVNGPKEGAHASERRLSTGMVGLPSDMHAVELTYGIRGVSLPVLENFVLNQPPRRPRPMSPPELSPKTLPQTISPAMLSIHTQNRPGEYGLQETPHQEIESCRTSENIVESTTPHQESQNLESATEQLHVLNMPINQPAPPVASSGVPKQSDAKLSSMPPPPAPRSEQSHATDSRQKCPISAEKTTDKTTKIGTHHGNSKQPCQICARMRQQANLARAQGIPMMPQNVPSPQLIPQVPCHQPYGQHLQPHMMAITRNGMHSFAPGFPMMMPIQGNSFPNFATHVSLPPPQPTQQTPRTHSPQNIGKPVPDNSAQATETKAQERRSAAPAPAANPSNLLKPPASLIQPTYRKPSPNLIVDVAETCQEKFPFEEVAQRHNAPVEKVFDVFAAIIQVPLLRCPTDRRRPGTLAKSRLREYTRAKRDIQETRGGADGRDKEGAAAVVTPLDIAHRMGTVEFPEGFSFGNR
ncbi:hypothetical protein DL770_004401 [Monosporascus sp. CRB-9-2]|nr:hypothetical protein DL770_004401 [Monosporascus sp. CRB-9-2]